MPSGPHTTASPSIRNRALILKQATTWSLLSVAVPVTSCSQVSTSGHRRIGPGRCLSSRRGRLVTSPELYRPVSQPSGPSLTTRDIAPQRGGNISLHILI